MQGIWRQLVTLAVIVQVVLVRWVSGMAIEQNEQALQQWQEHAINSDRTQARIGYDYSAPPQDLANPFQDHDIHQEIFDQHDHPGYRKYFKSDKKRIWKITYKKVWQPIWKVTKSPLWIEVKVPETDWKSDKWNKGKRATSSHWLKIYVPDKKLEWQETWKKLWVVEI